MVRFTRTVNALKGLQEKIIGLKVRGIDITRDPSLNKGMAFTLRERQTLGIHGLLPPADITQDQQAYRSILNFEKCETNLDKYLYLSALQDRNEKLFYRLLSENIEETLPIVYTPTVGLACQRWGFIYRKPRGLYLTMNDKGHVYDILCNWPEHDVKAIVVTDGERILGLGDLGAYGMGIPVGKLSLYTALGGLHPHQALPIMLDVGTNNETLLRDPLYIGLRQKRVRGQAYDELVDEFMEAVVAKFGSNTLIQFEDFANMNAYRLLDKYQYKNCTFNDDIQGTASVAVAGLTASHRITGKSMSDHVFLFNGAGSAACGIANFICEQMKIEGLSESEATSRIHLFDVNGYVTNGRDVKATGQMVRFAKDAPDVKGLEETVDFVKPTGIIGASGVGGTFTESILKKMGENNDRPVIFALSNPTSQAECTAEQAYRMTEGRCVFASGSPFGPVTLGDKTFVPGQGNNSYIFPGVALGVVAAHIRHITDRMFLIAAKTCADMVSQESIDSGSLYPPLDSIRELSIDIAANVIEEAYEEGMAAFHPKPKDLKDFLSKRVYSTKYDNFMPVTYDWPPNVAGYTGPVRTKQ